MILAPTILLLALQVLDWHLTRRVISQGGKELNPAMAWIIARFGFPGLLTVKLFIAAGIAWAAGLYDAWWIIAALDALYLWVCWHNWTQLKKG